MDTESAQLVRSVHQQHEDKEDAMTKKTQLRLLHHLLLVCLLVQLGRVNTRSNDQRTDYAPVIIENKRAQLHHFTIIFFLIMSYIIKM